MDFGWSAAQRDYLASVRGFATESLVADDLAERDAEGVFWREGWRRCAGFGIPGLPVTPEYGGGGHDRLTIVATLEELGYACRDNGLLFALNAHLWGCVTPLLAFGTDEQKKRYLPGLCDGSLVGGLAMTEAGSGSDAYNLRTTALPRDGGYLLNGDKVYVTNAPVADVLVVIARTGQADGPGSFSAFLVDRETPGLVTGPPVPKMGLRTAPMGALTLTDCWVPGHARLGPVGAGMSVFTVAMEWERSCILASAVGTMRHLLERCVSYAGGHERFAKPIGRFQAVSHKVVEMKLRLETSRLMLYHLAWSLTGTRRLPGASALVKLHLSEALVQTSMDALQLHGAGGYLTEEGLERQVRDALAARLYSGTSDIQRNIVARSLGL
ncbi:acyl-CoA dehydrogenase [Nonomuraea sp. NN258]|uniref:acyl-CoA dehydrogenase family protein n=1 Tax=Nonomuraea antri TaxID=2730852 RepID=UPI00156824B4|nr:acyl-CoA dehydrogenase family protein [Nonomuraea antri]NRQ33090.1 acyl-CoA dehydrogenase [Nonomuraea antri]